MIGFTSIVRISLFIGWWFQAVPVGAVAPPVILVLGDSLSAGYGINLQESWVAQLQERLSSEGYRYEVVNASISGETTRGALARLDTLLANHEPQIVVVELGGNDGLRGLPLSEIRQNLAKIIEKSQESDAKVLLVRMRLPPNYGPLYTTQFEKLFTELERNYGVATAPFILQGVALQLELMQPDEIHPQAEAQEQMLDNIWPALVPLL